MKKYMIFIAIFVIFMAYGIEVNGEAREEYGDAICIYEGDNGIMIVSFSSEWGTEEKLKTVYDELLNNTYGDEIAYLDAIYIYPDSPDNVASYYYHSYTEDENGDYIYNDGRYIELFNGDIYTDIKDIAKVIAHEYGHHFTFYYLTTVEKLSNSEWIDSNYAKIRNLDMYPQITYFGEDPLLYSHEWDIAEILAEDYVQLYGSELAKQTRDYYDIKERLHNNVVEYYYYYNDFNLLPQENLDLSLAADVEGLSDYFFELSGIPIQRPIETFEISAPNLSEINNIFKNYNEYVFRWDNIENLESIDGYEYTLLINNVGQNDYPIPLKTIVSGEPTFAVAGTAIDFLNGTAIYANYEGEYELRLFVKDVNGYMHSSEVVNIRITPKDNSVVKFDDVEDSYWAVDYIYDLTNRGLVKGFPDNTFRPLATISRAEFMTFLVRTLDDKEIIEVDSEHWFVSQGYRDIALEIGLLDEVNNNIDYFQNNITREEMAHMIYLMLIRLEVDTEIDFVTYLTDVYDHRSTIQISLVNYYGIINGYPDLTFKPDKDASRAEAIKMLSRYLDVINNNLSIQP